jgi:hypothetical protein
VKNAQLTVDRSVVTHFDPEKINRHHDAALIGLNGDRYQPFEE